MLQHTPNTVSLPCRPDLGAIAYCMGADSENDSQSESTRVPCQNHQHQVAQQVEASSTARSRSGTLDAQSRGQPEKHQGQRPVIDLDKTAVACISSTTSKMVAEGMQLAGWVVPARGCTSKGEQPGRWQAQQQMCGIPGTCRCING